VRPLGLINTNQIDAPSNVYDAGWYNQSSKPGQDGAMVVDGHVSSKSTKGVFYDMKSLKPGQSIVIEKGDGNKLTYSVTETRLYDAKSVDMAAVLSPVNPSKPGLNLITCAGSVVKGTNEFDKRIVVFAELN
jgi:sortase (surface protein transpeptidase)